MLSQMIGFYSFIDWIVTHCVCVWHFCFFTHSLVDMEVDATSWLQRIILQWTQECFFISILVSFPLNTYPTMGLLDHMVVLFLGWLVGSLFGFSTEERTKSFCTKLNPQPIYVMLLFWKTVSLSYPGQPQTYYSPALPSQNVSIIGIYHRTQLLI